VSGLPGALAVLASTTLPPALASRSAVPAVALRLDRTRRAFVLAALAIAVAGPRSALAARAPSPRGAPIEGVALDVQDGDSFVFRGDDGVRRRIRVSGIDAPENHQPFADTSRRALGAMLRGRRLRIEPVKHDVFDRMVARVLALDPSRADDTGRDVGLALVEAGLAWHFVRYKADQSHGDRLRYTRAERAARDARTGLWRDDAPEAPWDFRRRMRPGAAERPTAGAQGSTPPSPGR
jgi:endonuclease YncB( thermonuclease family)